MSTNVSVLRSYIGVTFNDLAPDITPILEDSTVALEVAVTPVTLEPDPVSKLGFATRFVTAATPPTPSPGQPP
ncbi:hypothetical protein D3C85_1784540 [compost metagenome]